MLRSNRTLHGLWISIVLAIFATAPMPIWAQSGLSTPVDSGVPAPLTSRASGWIGVVLPLEAVDVGAQTGGSLEDVFVRAGDEVSEGTLLAQIEAHDILQNLKIAEAELHVAEAEMEHQQAKALRAKSEFERRSTTADLWSEEEVTSSGLDARATEAEARAAAAEVEKAAATIGQLQHSLEHLEIRAPFAGHVAIRYLDAGAFVNSGAPIVRVVSGAARLVRFAVLPLEISRLELGADLEVSDTQGVVIGRAVVRHISPEIDLASERIFVEAILDGASLVREPRGGLGVEVRPGPSRPGPPRGQPE